MKNKFKSQNGFCGDCQPPLIVVLFVIAIGITGLIGYVMNIVKLTSCDWVISAEEVLRIIGVFTGIVGAVMGFIGHF